MNDYTPGPWHVDTDSDDRWLGVWNENGCVAAIESNNAYADANLIAAAPDLYDALRDVLLNAGSAIDTEWLERAMTAIAKAEGRNP